MWASLGWARRVRHAVGSCSVLWQGVWLGREGPNARPANCATSARLALWMMSTVRHAASKLRLASDTSPGASAHRKSKKQRNRPYNSNNSDELHFRRSASPALEWSNTCRNILPLARWQEANCQSSAKKALIATTPKLSEALSIKATSVLNVPSCKQECAQSYTMTAQASNRARNSGSARTPQGEPFMPDAFCKLRNLCVMSNML